MKKETRVVNIPKEDFDYIKEYCDKNNLNMVKWMVTNILNKIASKISFYLPEKIINEKTKIINTLFPTKFGLIPALIHSSEPITFDADTFVLRTFFIFKTWFRDNNHYTNNELKKQMTFVLDSLLQYNNTIVGITVEVRNKFSVSMYINDDNLYFTK